MSRIRYGIAGVLATVAFVAAGCGGDGAAVGSDGTEAPGGAAPIAGVPPALAANREQANLLLDEGELGSKLADLEGHPVVVNQWASWCEPCRAELPYFADAADAHAKSIGFVGIDMQDDRGAAEDFLTEIPLPYPSVYDPNAEEIGSLGGGFVSPTTVYIDESGNIVKVFQGAYASQAQLEADIDRYLTKRS